MNTATERNPFASRYTASWWDKSADDEKVKAGTMSSKEYCAIWGCWPVRNKENSHDTR